MNALSIISQVPHINLADFEMELRIKHPNWNEKYYLVLMKAMEKLTQPDARVSLTANELIRESHSSRPTWYSYFNSVEHYYSNILPVLGDAILEHAMRELKRKANSWNWTTLLQSQQLVIYLSNTRPLADYFQELKPVWLNIYNKTLEGYTRIYTPLLELSEGRTRLLVSSLINELIVHPKKYLPDNIKFQQYVKSLYILFLKEQNI